MKYGVRKPSVKRSVKARTTGKITRSVKKATNPLYGKKGMGVISNPKKAAYNAVYSRSTVGVRGKSHGGSHVSSDPVVFSAAPGDVPVRRKRGGMVRIVMGAILAFFSLVGFSDGDILTAAFVLFTGIFLVYFGIKKRKEFTE